MAAAEPHYLFKMLSGPHLGAEVRLAAGSYRVGRDDEADIVLDDHAMAGEHALVTIAAEGVRVEPLLGEVLVENAPHRDAARLLPFFTVIGLGTTHVAIGPEGGAWPALAAPAGLAVASGPAPPATAEGALPAPVPGPTAPRPVWQRSAWWVAAPLLLLVLVLLARPLAHGPAPAAPAAAPDPAVSLAALEPAVKTALAGLTVEGLRLEPDGRRDRLLVEGWLPDEADRKTALARLDALNAPLLVRLWSREQVLAGVATTLQALGRPLETTWTGPGEVKISGYIQDGSDLQRVVDLLQRDVTGLKAVDNQVVTEDKVAAWLEQRLNEAKLADVLKIKRGDRALQVRGLLSPDQRLAFTKVADAYADGPGRYLTLEAQIGEAASPAPAAAAPPPEMARFAVRAASPGPPAFVVLEDGQKYLEGSRLPGGWTLEHIDGSEMVVARDGRREAVSF